jgi:hypothetical protein
MFGNAWQDELPIKHSEGMHPASRLLATRQSPHVAGSVEQERQMADEKVRVIAFDTVDLDDGDWDGPHVQGEFLAYTSKHAAASIRVTKGGKVVIDGDYGARKTLLIDDDVIHLPEGMGREI